MNRSLEAKDSIFLPATLSVPADKPFKITFLNSDSANTHNVTIASSAGALILNGKIITGVSSISYPVAALPAGDYRLGCIVHPAMTGTLAVR